MQWRDMTCASAGYNWVRLVQTSSSPYPPRVDPPPELKSLWTGYHPL